MSADGTQQNLISGPAAVAAPTSRRVDGPVVRFAADLVCPWCWIGFTRLRRAVGTTPCRLVWEPFFLNPHLPADGIDGAAYLRRKFGTLENARSTHARVARVAAADGLALPFRAAGRQPNTLVAHALVLLAQERGLAAAAAARLFHLSLAEGADIGRAEILQPVAAELGLRLEEALMWLSPVLSAHNAACAAGVDGVPLFRFGADHLIAGAQPEPVLRALLDLERARCAEG